MLIKFLRQVIQKNPLKCKGTIMRINANRLVCNLMKQVNNGIPLGINFNTLIN